jgi:hypothetical protein
VPQYQGHKNWNHWNVSLWISNDEPLYRMAQDYVRRCATKDQAAREMLYNLERSNTTTTPDGASYSVSSIRAAMAEM